MHSKEIKEEIDKLRASGATYSQISSKFHISKSTLSYWFNKKYKHIFDRSAQLTHLAKIRPIAHQAIQKRIQENINTIKTKIKKEITGYPLQDKGFQKSILASLYWAEGSKYPGVNGMKFANSDPKLARLYIQLLRNTFTIDEKKIRIALYLHKYHKELTCKKFWSTTLLIPQSQFYKTY